MIRKNKLLSILIISLLSFLSGCNTICDLDNFIIPNDIRFMECVAELDTVPLIAQYMEEYFTYCEHFWVYSPYQMWLYKYGDCNDYAVFGVFAARCNGIEAYQVQVWYAEENTHINAVYKVEDYWVLTDCWVYHGRFISIEQAIILHSDYCERDLIKFKILNGVRDDKEMILYG